MTPATERSVKALRWRASGTSGATGSLSPAGGRILNYHSFCKEYCDVPWHFYQ
jgi:hypothetical protein